MATSDLNKVAKSDHITDRINESVCKALAMSSVLQHYVCDDHRDVDVTPEYLRWYFNALEQHLGAAKDAAEELSGEGVANG